jgi:translation initiation factor 3 subunit C
MASKFFAYGSSSDSEKEEEVVEEVAVALPVTKGKFIVAFDSDTESEDEGRVVRSEKDRTWNNIFERVCRIRSAIKINDWSTIHDEFEDVNKQVDKAKMLVMHHGLPPFYVKMLMEVEDIVTTAVKDKETMSKMKPVVARALNRMKLVVRKHNKKYESELALCREKPDDFKDPEVVAKKRAAVQSSDSDSSDSESDSDSDSDKSSSSAVSVCYKTASHFTCCICIIAQALAVISCNDSPFLVSESRL